jgi:DNA-binding IscR family transcriptional regulator
VRGARGGYRFAGAVSRTTLLDVIQIFESLESELEAPDRRSRASALIVEELKSLTDEIDDLTRAVLDTITLETALNNTRQRTARRGAN